MIIDCCNPLQSVFYSPARVAEDCDPYMVVMLIINWFLTHI